jgi:hypothetical protein
MSNPSGIGEIKRFKIPGNAKGVEQTLLKINFQAITFFLTDKDRNHYFLNINCAK